MRKQAHQRILTRAAVSMIAFSALMVILLTGAFGVLAQGQFGTNWTVQYFNNRDLSGTPAITTTAPNGVNFNWGTSPPDPSFPNTNWSARFTSVQVFAQGTYEFFLTSDDGARLLIDNVTVIDRFVDRPLTTDRIQVTLTAGAHQLQVDYFQGIDQAAVSLQWIATNVATTPTQGSGGGQIFVTATPFGTPVATQAYTGPVATVSGVRGLALRTGPYMGASYITALPGDTAYPVLARNPSEGIYNWYYLQVGDRFGWASGRFLTISVDINALPIRNSIFDEIDGAVNANAIGITRAVMNMRVRPSVRTARIASIPWGATVEVLGRTVQAGTDRWYHVRFEGQVGWINAAWVTVRGERFNIPIR
jgi:uncharacterized protein YraI